MKKTIKDKKLIQIKKQMNILLNKYLTEWLFEIYNQTKILFGNY